MPDDEQTQDAPEEITSEAQEQPERAGQQPVEQPAPSVSVIAADPLFGKDVGGRGRNELTDFG